jgi:putative FmdB family regulatory protein
MPVYDYLCARCGSFTVLRPMAKYERPHPCPDCGAKSPRAMLTPPRLAGLPAEMRKAHAINEKSRHEPDICAGGNAHAAQRHSHKGGRSKPESGGRRDSQGSTAAMKSFPVRRPWMLSH